MADTLTNIPLPANVYVDLYAASGITVGNVIRVQNVGSADIYLTAQATQPTLSEDAYSVLPPRIAFALNEDGDSGAWGISPNKDGKVQILEVV